MFATPLGDGTYRCDYSRATLILSAESQSTIDRFLAHFAPVQNSHSDRWAVACALIDSRVDWPLWHEEHLKAHAAFVRGEEYFDPWEHAEAGGISQTEPMVFADAYRGLKELCGENASQYFLKAWTTSQVIDAGDLRSWDAEARRDFELLRNCGASLPLRDAPIAELLRFAKRDDLVACFRALQIPRPRSNVESIVALESKLADPEVEAAFRAVPRWQSGIMLLPPTGMTWESFQDFRYLLKAMASDLAAYATGFRVFTKRW